MCGEFLEVLVFLFVELNTVISASYFCYFSKKLPERAESCLIVDYFTCRNRV